MKIVLIGPSFFLISVTISQRKLHLTGVSKFSGKCCCSTFWGITRWFLKCTENQQLVDFNGFASSRENATRYLRKTIWPVKEEYVGRRLKKIWQSSFTAELAVTQYALKNWNGLNQCFLILVLRHRCSTWFGYFSLPKHLIQTISLSSSTAEVLTKNYYKKTIKSTSRFQVQVTAVKTSITHCQ